MCWKACKEDRFNPNKVVLDPYAKGIARQTKWSDNVWGYNLGDQQSDLSFDERDSAPCAPLAAVIDEAFTWGDDRPPQTPWNKTIIYEMHVKGFTQKHPLVPPDQAGKYAGLASAPVLQYLRSLGVTAVELMPTHQFINDRLLIPGEVGRLRYRTPGSATESYGSRKDSGDVPGGMVLSG